MTQPHTRIDFRANSQRVPSNIAAATLKNSLIAMEKRGQAIAALGEDQWEQLRQAGHEVRLQAITHLDEYLQQVEERVTEAGGIVHWAEDASEACRIVTEIAAQHGARRVVKVKSMATEEIGLNRALQAAGLSVLETDLGEYIVQLAGQTPSHVTAPALHMSKEEIAALFREKLGADLPADPLLMTEFARGRLRQEFLAADMGISGANFLVAETGTLVIATNEGNGRLCTSLPRVHVAVVGIEKVIPDWRSLAVLLKLLARSATGQKITCYTTLITGRWHGGPEEFHLVLLDNGRTRILADPVARETLLCIRCGACLNACPVYQTVGGHAYGWIYSGPIGAIVAPQLLGTDLAGALPFASSLCGACAEVCPVKIPIPEILLHLRHRVLEGDRLDGPSAPASLRVAARLGALALGTAPLYEFGSQLLRLVQAPLRRSSQTSPTGGWLPALPPPLNRWTLARPFPAFRPDFRGWWRKRDSST